MSEFSNGNVPGLRAAVESQSAQVWWSGRGGQNQIATHKAVLDASNVDAGNSPTTTLRGGQVLALDDATGRAFLYDPDANDGRQIAAGVLEQPQDMLVDGAAAHRFVQMLVQGLLKESALLGLDPRAKSQLAARFRFDVEPAGRYHLEPRGIYRKSANYAVTAADHGLLFLATAEVTFTLPAKQNGLAFRFFQTADADLMIAGSGDLVHKHSAAADSVAFSTAMQKIGSHALVECVYTDTGTLKWLVSNLGGTTATVA